MSRGRLLRCILLSLAVAMTAAYALADGPPQDPGPPRLVCEEPVYDFGTVGNTGPLSHTFVLGNDGEAPLRIVRVAACASCTHPELSRRLVPPGETAELSTHASLYGKEGPVSYDITVRTNDPDRRTLRLEIRGVVEPWVRIEPLKVRFTRQPDDEVAEVPVDVRITDKHEPFAVTAAEPSADWLAAELEALKEGRHYRLVVRTKPPMPRGWHEEHVRLVTDSDDIGTIDVPVTAMIVGELMVWPEKISVVDTGRGDRVSRQVDVLPGKVKRFEVVSVQPPVPMDVTVAETGLHGTGRRIRLRNIPVSTELAGAELVITTDVEGMREIRVPFEVKQGRPCPSCP